MPSSVKSGAAAMPTSPATRSGRRGRHAQRDPAPHRGSDQHLRPLGQRADRGDRVLGPVADAAVEEVARTGPVPGIVEPQEGPTPRPRPVLQKTALVPVMSDRNPPRNTTPGCPRRCGDRRCADPAACPETAARSRLSSGLVQAPGHPGPGDCHSSEDRQRHPGARERGEGAEYARSHQRHPDDRVRQRRVGGALVASAMSTRCVLRPTRTP
jgi:hypothetical protein